MVAALAVAGALGAALILINGAPGFRNSWRQLTASRLYLAYPAPVMMFRKGGRRR